MAASAGRLERAEQEAGRQLFATANCGIPTAQGEINVLTCASCHQIDPNANPGTARGTSEKTPVATSHAPRSWNPS